MIYFASVIAYLLLLLGIGIWKSRQVKSEEDFAVAGRSLSPWVMVCTMLAVWVGTGSIVGNAEKTYETGAAAFILPIGGFLGMIALSLVARAVRTVKASSVPEIIGLEFGQAARFLAVISLIIAYMVIVSYQFNAGGAVIEVIAGDRDPVRVEVGDELSYEQLRKGRLRYQSEAEWAGAVEVELRAETDPPRDVAFEIEVVTQAAILAGREVPGGTVRIQEGHYRRLTPAGDDLLQASYRVTALPEHGAVLLVEPKITAGTATIIAAVFIILFTMLAGLMSLAYADIVTGSVIMVTMVVAGPLYWFMAGGFEGISAGYVAQGREEHLQFWGVYSPVEVVNFCLPSFLLLLGDANQYQRIFASRTAKGAKSAVTTMIFVSAVVELLIIACAWISGSMTPDPENGKYVLIHAAKTFLPPALGCVFMVTVVGIIVSTANSFLLVPATVFIKDVYRNHINENASEKRVLFLSRGMVLFFGVVAYLVSLAFAESTGFFQKALYAFTIYGASVTPSLVAALVWKGATKAGAITSILSGTVVTLLWEEVIKARLPGGWGELDAVLPAITISVLCLVLVSLLTKKSEAQAPA